MPLTADQADLDLDKILRILENPARRRIVQRLSQEPDYSFQMARDMALSQQQVSKHLAIMEDAGIVSSAATESSRGGPKRRNYKLNKSFWLSIEVAPHLYKEKVLSFDTVPGEGMGGDSASLMKRIREIVESPGEDSVSRLEEVLSKIDQGIDRLEEEMATLLYVRNCVMREASNIFQGIDGADARKIIHNAFDRHETSIKDISRSLNLREDRVSKIIEGIREKLNTDYI